MGVTGLWRLIEPAGKPVPVETLENKVLAVDISIWLHQVVKGYQDAKGAPLPNAHLIGLFQRLCKLLYFRIKPVFVFDGGFPDLKRETIAKRQDSKSKYHSESERLKRELAVLLSKKTAIGSLLGKQISPKKGSSAGEHSNSDDMFKLPALPQNDESESESEDDQDTSSGSIVDLHSADLDSDKFKNLPAKEKYDLLVELKETRKMNSWGKLHTLPKKSDNFSDFQLQRLLKRRKVQECLEETEKEMGDVGMSFNDLESLLNEEGIDTKIESLPTRRIASNTNTRYLLINNVREALAKAKERKLNDAKPESSGKTDTTLNVQPIGEKTKEPVKKDDITDDLQKAIQMSLECENEPDTSASSLKPKKDELEDDLQKAIQMSLECANEPDTSACTSKTDDSWTSVLTDTDYSASDSEGELEQPDLTSAKAYILQYSDYTHKAIERIVAPRKCKNKPKAQGITQILEEIHNEKSIIDDNVELSSEDEDLEIKTVKSSLKKQNEDKINDTIDVEENVDCTQASVMFVENTEPEVISLDSSMEENVTGNDKTSEEGNKSSESSDDEFEEVAQEEECKPVVELTLKMDKPLDDDDDIFADVFAPQEKKDYEDNMQSKVVRDEVNVKEEAINDVVMPIEDKKHEDLIKSKVSQIERFVSHQESVKGQISDKVTSENSAKTTKELETKQGIERKPTNETINMNEKSDNILKRKEVNSISDKKNTIQESNQPSTEEVVEKNTNPKINKQPKEPLSNEQLNTMVEEIRNEEQDLIQEKGRLDRIGRNITEQMTKEAQELLQIFGIPYIVAPMEAEAQCAFLESVKLTDGTITDDSDIWLFGGKTVYKNFFNQKKHVLQYLSERIEKSYNLSREQLILLALLVGSDYTTGVAGVGPVTALEILASFPFNKKQFLNETCKQVKYAKILDGLKEFKLWVRAGRRTDNTSLKKKLRNINLSDDFPSPRVVQAYLEPNVEKSDDKFTWGEMDITILRDYAKSKFGWSQNKFDEIIKPVLARMKDRKNQKTVHDYFKRKVEFQTLEEQMSKRVKAAVQKMGPEGIVGEEKSNDVEVLTTAKKRKRVVKNKVEAGPSKPKERKTASKVDHVVKVVSEDQDGRSSIEINIPKSDRFQEIIPQREKDKKHLLENKLKAIELFRKTKIDRKVKPKKRKPNLPKDKADLSESSSEDN